MEQTMFECRCGQMIPDDQCNVAFWPVACSSNEVLLGCPKCGASWKLHTDFPLDAALIARTPRYQQYQRKWKARRALLASQERSETT
jgi:hypothetical protein